MKPKITALKSIDETRGYTLSKSSELHKSLVPLCMELGIQDVGSVDRIFDESFTDDFLYLSGEKTEVFLFGSEKNVLLVLKSDLEASELNEVLQKHLDFPG